MRLAICLLPLAMQAAQIPAGTEFGIRLTDRLTDKVASEAGALAVSRKPKIQGSSCQSPRAQRCWRAAETS